MAIVNLSKFFLENSLKIFLGEVFGRKRQK